MVFCQDSAPRCQRRLTFFSHKETSQEHCMLNLVRVMKTSCDFMFHQKIKSLFKYYFFVCGWAEGFQNFTQNDCCQLISRYNGYSMYPWCFMMFQLFSFLLILHPLRSIPTLSSTLHLFHILVSITVPALILNYLFALFPVISYKEQTLLS